MFNRGDRVKFNTQDASKRHQEFLGKIGIVLGETAKYNDCDGDDMVIVEFPVDEGSAITGVYNLYLKSLEEIKVVTMKELEEHFDCKIKIIK